MIKIIPNFNKIKFNFGKLAPFQTVLSLGTRFYICTSKVAIQVPTAVMGDGKYCRIFGREFFSGTYCGFFRLLSSDTV
eukprot:SAG11_NODE_13932_length_632_cov_3.333959_1_plen_78_part_00